MKKFLMLHYGYEEPTTEVMAAWQSWFTKVGDHFADIGSPLGNCLEVSKTGRREMSSDMGAATGYSIISAENLGRRPTRASLGLQGPGRPRRRRPRDARRCRTRAGAL